jgi:hypothetical protein
MQKVFSLTCDGIEIPDLEGFLRFYKNLQKQFTHQNSPNASMLDPHQTHYTGLSSYNQDLKKKFLKKKNNGSDFGVMDLALAEIIEEKQDLLSESRILINFTNVRAKYQLPKGSNPNDSFLNIGDSSLEKFNESKLNLSKDEWNYVHRASSMIEIPTVSEIVMHFDFYNEYVKGVENEFNLDRFEAGLLVNFVNSENFDNSSSLFPFCSTLGAGFRYRKIFEEFFTKKRKNSAGFETPAFDDFLCADLSPTDPQP